MRIGAKKAMVGAAAGAWLVVAMWAAAGGNGTSLGAATLGSRPPTIKTPQAVMGPACAANGYTASRSPNARFR